MFLNKLVDKKNDKVKFDLIPETYEEYISVTYGCIRFIDSHRFLSSSLDSSVEILFNISHKTMNNLKEEIVDNDEFLKIINEKKTLIEGDRYNNDCIKDLKKDYPEKN